MRLSAIRPGTEAIRRYTESGYWIETTTNEVLVRNARAFPTKDALFDGRVRLNHADYYRRWGFRRIKPTAAPPFVCANYWLGYLGGGLLSLLRGRAINHLAVLERAS